MKKFEMTQEQLDVLLNASTPVPMIALQCGTPRSSQQNADAAWKELGKVMGFVIAYDKARIDHLIGGLKARIAELESEQSESIDSGGEHHD